MDSVIVGSRFMLLQEEEMQNSAHAANEIIEINQQVISEGEAPTRKDKIGSKNSKKNGQKGGEQVHGGN